MVAAEKNLHLVTFVPLKTIKASSVCTVKSLSCCLAQHWHFAVQKPELVHIKGGLGVQARFPKTYDPC